MILKAHASFSHARTWVLKLHDGSPSTPGRIAGRLEHVASGRQFHFSSGEELLACLEQTFPENES